MRLELDSFRALLGALGAPQERFPAVVVGGTNGKGSVAALLATMASAAGLRVGLYTSPHLTAWEERIRIADRDIEPRALASRLEEVLTAAQSFGLAPPTVFEVLTAAALIEFARQRVDLAILEVGLGGRLDATNAVTPIISAISRVSLDHREWLGSSLSEIAGEKAGILRATRPAIVAPQQSEADATIADRAARLGAVLHRVENEVELLSAEWRGLAGHRIRMRSPRREYALTLSLAGEHQIWNLATAVRIAEELESEGFGIGEEAIVRGAATVRWPARLEALELLPSASDAPARCCAQP